VNIVTTQDYAEFFQRNSALGLGAAKDNLLLTAWTNADWRKLLSLTMPRTVRTGEFVISRNTPDRTLYLVASGEYEVGIMHVGRATIRPIASISAGSVIGDQSFFDGLPRSANVWASTAGVLLQLEFAAYERFAQAEPALAGNLVFALGRVLSMRLRSATLRTPDPA